MAASGSESRGSSGGPGSRSKVDEGEDERQGDSEGCSNERRRSKGTFRGVENRNTRQGFCWKMRDRANVERICITDRDFPKRRIEMERGEWKARRGQRKGVGERSRVVRCSCVVVCSCIVLRSLVVSCRRDRAGTRARYRGRKVRPEGASGAMGTSENMDWVGMDSPEIVEGEQAMFRDGVRKGLGDRIRGVVTRARGGQTKTSTWIAALHMCPN